MHTPGPKDWLALLTLTLFWGTAFAFTRVALGAFPPEVLAALRIGIAAAVLLGFAWWSTSQWPRGARQWAQMFVMGLFGTAMPFLLNAWAQQHIESAMTGVLMALLPLFLLVLSHFYVPGARLTAARVAGFLLGFSGVVLVIGPESVNALEGNLRFWAALAVLGAALSYAISTIYARTTEVRDPVVQAASMLLMGALMISPLALPSLDQVVTPIPGPALWSILVLGLLCTGLASVLYFRLVHGPGPTFLSLINYMVPGWAVLTGAAFLQERLSASALWGLALILSGVAVSEFGPRMRRWLGSRQPPQA